MIFTILSHFDNIVGPMISLKIPKSTTPINFEKIPFLMDLYKEGFFIHEIDELKTANLIFEISSPIARGHIERLMFSIVSIEEKYNLSLRSFRDIMEFFVQEFKKIKNVYKGFHYEILLKGREKYNEIADFIYSFHQILSDKITRANQNISKIITYGLSPLGKSSLIKSLQNKFLFSGHYLKNFSTFNPFKNPSLE
ncbi:MAG: hypothetical protein ACFFAN_01600 [Promethearchaeota archaeon]